MISEIARWNKGYPTIAGFNCLTAINPDTRAILTSAGFNCTNQLNPDTRAIPYWIHPDRAVLNVDIALDPHWLLKTSKKLSKAGLQ